MKALLRCGCEAHTELTPHELAPGLHGLQCTSCEGQLLQLDDYRAWRDKTPTPPVADAMASDEDPHARNCPACARLMQRFRVGAKPDFRVDRCTSCQNVWFARGEWQAFVAAGLGSRLDEVLTDAWQRQLQADELRQGREQVLRQRHGAEAMDELARIRQWLKAQPGRDELLALLRAD